MKIDSVRVCDSANQVVWATPPPLPAAETALRSAGLSVLAILGVGTNVGGEGFVGEELEPADEAIEGVGTPGGIALGRAEYPVAIRADPAGKIVTFNET
jgi:hypothetical protein